MSVEADIVEIKGTLSGVLTILETMNGVLNQILAGMAGDGSDELVAVLKRLAEGQENMITRLDALPDVIEDRIGD